MKTIGEQKLRKFRNPRTGEPLELLIEDSVSRLTEHNYGHNSKYSRKLIVTLGAPDTITIKPKGFRADALIVTANIGELYKMLLARRCAVEALVKARAKKEANKEARARRARYAQERRFKASLKD